MKTILILLLLVPKVSMAFVSEDITGKTDQKKTVTVVDKTSQQPTNADIQKSMLEYENKLKEFQKAHPEMLRGKNQNK